MARLSSGIGRAVSTEAGCHEETAVPGPTRHTSPIHLWIGR